MTLLPRESSWAAKPPFDVGDWVRCTYRARWRGVVVVCERTRVERGNCLFETYWKFRVQQLVDRRGAPVRNKRVVRYGWQFFERTRPVDGLRPTATARMLRASDD